MGVELIDFAGKSVIKAGDHKIDRSKYTEINLEAGERIIGMKSGRRGRTVALNYDV